ncbi:tyrosine-type recombinase/integrase [Perlabentimonas gracilis]|uniref:tyrosine-type recombinase/integrase n=1 Tax=Perlabentimonas gracilis TaxID=2715279 RepID=UPI00140C897F|nr:tyrosine-type recombinase/integrase [Perlabentimonas gracilis]NHB70311.1 tyrosine-type recombinase/integrase [Perlabentimonas gracilis]
MIKANINIYLKKENPDQDGKVHLYGQVTYDGRKIRKNLCKVKPKYWNRKSQTFKSGDKPKAVNSEITSNQKIISRFNEHIKNFFTDANYNGITPTFDEVKLHVLSEPNDKSKDSITLKLAFEEFIEQKANPNTKKTVRAVYNFLLGFEKNTGNNLSYENLTINLYDKLKDYAYKVEKISNNYFANITKYIKAFLTWSHKRDYYHGTLQHNIKKQEKPKTIVYLTEKELDLLYSYKFDNVTHGKIRDIFCFGCYTGLRISDLQTLTHNHIADGMIVKTTVKTNEEVIIALTEKPLEILERYKDKPLLALPKFEEQYINRQLKEICKIAGINQPTIVLKHIGDKPTEEQKPKYELITMHVSRKTFINHCVRLKIAMHILRRMTGLTSDSELTKYYKIGPEQIKEEMKKWDS